MEKINWNKEDVESDWNLNSEGMNFFADGEYQIFPDDSIDHNTGDLSRSNPNAVAVANPREFQTDSVVSREIRVVTRKRLCTASASNGAPATTPEEMKQRIKFYMEGDGSSILVSCLSQCRETGIHIGYRLEAVQTVWDLTRDRAMLSTLHAKGVTTCMLELAREFAPVPTSSKAAKTEDGSDSKTIQVVDVCLSIFVLQEQIRCMIILSLANLSYDEEVQKVLISAGMKDVRAQVMALCRRYVQQCYNENVCSLEEMVGGVAGSAMTPKKLADAGATLASAMYGAMQAAEHATPEGPQHVPPSTTEEQQELKAILDEYKNISAPAPSIFGRKRTLIQTRRVAVC